MKFFFCVISVFISALASAAPSCMEVNDMSLFLLYQQRKQGNYFLCLEEAEGYFDPKTVSCLTYSGNPKGLLLVFELFENLSSLDLKQLEYGGGNYIINLPDKLTELFISDDTYDPNSLTLKSQTLQRISIDIREKESFDYVFAILEDKKLSKLTINCQNQVSISKTTFKSYQVDTLVCNNIDILTRVFPTKHLEICSLISQAYTTDLSDVKFSKLPSLCLNNSNIDQFLIFFDHLEHLSLRSDSLVITENQYDFSNLKSLSVTFYTYCSISPNLLAQVSSLSKLCFKGYLSMQGVDFTTPLALNKRYNKVFLESQTFVAIKALIERNDLKELTFDLGHYVDFSDIAPSLSQKTFTSLYLHHIYMNRFQLNLEKSDSDIFLDRCIVDRLTFTVNREKWENRDKVRFYLTGYIRPQNLSVLRNTESGDNSTQKYIMKHWPYRVLDFWPVNRKDYACNFTPAECNEHALSQRINLYTKRVSKGDLHRPINRNKRGNPRFLDSRKLNEQDLTEKDFYSLFPMFLYQLPNFACMPSMIDINRNCFRRLHVYKQQLLCCQNSILKRAVNGIKFAMMYCFESASPFCLEPTNDQSMIIRNTYRYKKYKKRKNAKIKHKTNE